MGKEASLKKLPEPSEVARALDQLDDTVLDMELLQVVKDGGKKNRELAGVAGIGPPGS